MTDASSHIKPARSHVRWPVVTTLEAALFVADAGFEEKEMDDIITEM